MAATGSAVFQALTAYGGQVGAGLFANQTATGENTSATVASTQYCEFVPLSSTGEGTAGTVAGGAVEFEAITSTGSTPAFTDIKFEALTVVANGVAGTLAAGVPFFKGLSAAVAANGGSLASGTAVFQQLRSNGLSRETAIALGAAAFLRQTVSAAGFGGSAALAAVSFKQLEALGVGVAPTVAIGAAVFDPLSAAGLANPVLAETYRTWVMNVSNDVLTEYQNYNFNSLAEFDGSFYGAGLSGVHKLAGTSDAGTNIAWTYRTGWIDDKNAMLKRLNEVLLSIRFNGPLRLRVWTDEETFFEYNVVNHRPGVVHQVRAKLGKGLRSRFYRIQLSGIGATSAEVNSMQLPMIPLQRRLG